MSTRKNKTGQLHISAQAYASNLTGEEAINPQGKLVGASHMNGGGGVTYTPTEEQVTVTVTSTSLTTKDAIIFDGNSRYPADSEIDVVYKNRTRQEIINKLLASPLAIKGIRYDYGERDQLKHDFTKEAKDGGKIISDTYDPSVNENPENRQPVIDDADFSMVLNQNSALKIPMEACKPDATGKAIPRTIKVTFRVHASVNIGNGLVAKSPIEQNQMQGTGSGYTNPFK